MSGGAERDFFISYTGKDDAWARWIMVQLESAGYSTFIQAFDIRPGTDFAHEMQRATEQARCTIAVLSPDYLVSEFGESEWRVAFGKDPSGEKRLLIPVRVRPVKPPGLLSTRVYIDLVDRDEPTARRLLLDGVDPEPSRPKTAVFPGSHTRHAAPARDRALFPGRQAASAAPRPDPADSTFAVMDAAGNVTGSAFLLGTDFAVTATTALPGDEPVALQVPGRPDLIPVIDVDTDDGLGVALLWLDSGPGRPALTFSYEDVNVVGRAVRIPGHAADATTTVHEDSVAGAIARRYDDRTVTLLQLATAPEHIAPGAPVVDTDTGSVVGVLRPADDAAVALTVPFSEISRRWPVLAQLEPGVAVTYDAVVPTHLPVTLARSAWTRFTPQRLHCVVVTSEAAQDEAPADRLDMLVSNVFAGLAADSVWQAFRYAATRQPLVDGSGSRDLPEDYEYSSVLLAAFGVLDAYDSEPSLKLAARLIIEADLALFDVTGFEPGIMLLLGIRAATRRGVTLVSHGRLGDGRPWQAGEPLDRPFNLSDLAIASHTPTDDPRGTDQREERMQQRIVAGFSRLRSSPLYKDLPVYDALRALGSGADARRTIPLKEEVLVLCSYDKLFYGNWRHLRSRVQLALAKSKARGTVVRLQDVEDPQLVSLALYDRIRRCTGCIADWTRSSPSTFFELGVRIAASQWGVVQIVSTSWIAEASTMAAKGQFNRMLTLLDPVRYDDTTDEAIGANIAARLIEIRERQGVSGLRAVAAEALARVDAAMPDVVAVLREEADALQHPKQQSENVPRALYYEIPAIKQDQERAALERRIAAWLYLDRRLSAGTRPPHDPLHREWIVIGRQAASGLFDSRVEGDQELFLEISEEWGNEPDDDLDDVKATATLVRQRGDVLRRLNPSDPETAEKEYLAGIKRIDDFREACAAAGVVLSAADQAELFGIRGGLYRRCGRLRDALDSYRDGAEYEPGAVPPSTYNRTNAIKLGLRVGDRLAALRSTIDETATTLAELLQKDEKTADNAWTWADLGDVRLLQGDLAGAEEAYATFTRKATSSSPASTLSALEQVADDMDRHGDPAAGGVRAAVERVRPLLSR